jgi:hypothetical protein
VDQTTGDRLHPRLTGEGAIAAVGSSDQVLTVAAFRRSDISAVDPRWNLAGSDAVWIVRTLGAADSNGPTRPVLVSLVNDGTADAVDAHDLALGSTYQPARLWTIATAKGFDCCAGNLFPFFRVSGSAGTSVHEGMVSANVSGHADVTTYGPGVPLLLDPGTYSVHLWLAAFDHGVIGAAVDGCSTHITLHALDDLMLDARFPGPGDPCTFGEPSPPKLTR